MHQDPDIVFRLGEVVELPAPPAGRAFGRLRVLSVGDAKAARPRGYLVKGLVERGALSVVYGEPGCGKSFFAQHLGWRVAQGREAFGRRVHQAGVLYLALEGEGGFGGRVTGFAQEYGTTDAFHYVAQSVNFYSDPQAVGDVAQAAKALGAKLLVVDTLARAIGEGDENTAGDMGRLIAAVDGLRQATGAHVMIVHHTGKDESRGMRGHSSLNGAADITLHVTAGSEARQAEVKKNKDGVSGVALGFALKPVVTGRDEDGDEIVTMAVDEVTASPRKAARLRVRLLTANEQMWFEAIANFIAEEDPPLVAPRRGMALLRAVTRPALAAEFRQRELIAVTDDVMARRGKAESFTAAERQKMQRVLNALRAKKKLAFTREHVWLL